MKQKPRITISVDFKGIHREKKINPKIICALFDLQYIIGNDVWDTLKLNKIEKDINEFFDIIEKIDDTIHEEGRHEWKGSKNRKV